MFYEEKHKYLVYVSMYTYNKHISKDTGVYMNINIHICLYMCINMYLFTDIDTLCRCFNVNDYSFGSLFS